MANASPPQTARAPRAASRVIVNRFDEMLEQSAAQPLVCTVSLHPFVVGQPFRLRLLRQALQHCVEHPRRVRGSRPVPPVVRYSAR